MKISGSSKSPGDLTRNSKPPNCQMPVLSRAAITTIIVTHITSNPKLLQGAVLTFPDYDLASSLPSSTLEFLKPHKLHEPYLGFRVQGSFRAVKIKHFITLGSLTSSQAGASQGENYHPYIPLCNLSFHFIFHFFPFGFSSIGIISLNPKPLKCSNWGSCQGRKL